jgi:hypothetical protein
MDGGGVFGLGVPTWRRGKTGGVRMAAMAGPTVAGAGGCRRPMGGTRWQGDEGESVDLWARWV